MEEDEYRSAARKRLQAKQGFINYLFVWLGVTIVVLLVWWLTGAGYFWPGWVIGGMGIAAFFAWLNSYGPGNRTISDSAVDEEVRRMKGGS